MKIICRTNIDKWKMTKWPENFYTVPVVGDHIEGIGPGDYRPVLDVVSRTHTFDSRTGEAMLIIELHKVGVSLHELGWDK